MRRFVAGEPGLAREGEAEVGVQAALVKLVHDDGPEVGEQRILLEPRGQDALCHDEQAGVWAEPALESDLPSNLAADRPALLLRGFGERSPAPPGAAAAAG